MILIFLLHFVVIIQGTNVTNVLDNIALYANLAADIVSVVTECELRCPDG